MPASSTLTFGDLRLDGESRAGTETWIRVRPPGIAFDVGRGALPLEGVGTFFLSHGHLDHALGLPFVLSHRTQRSGKTARVYCPRPIAEPLRDLVAAAEQLEDGTFSWDLVPLDAGARVEVAPGWDVEAFATDHVVPSLGYHLWRRRRILKSAYRDLPGAELGRLRAAGEALEGEAEERVLSYCGDTGPAIFDLEPRIFSSRILLLECTFFGADRHVHARRFKHLHLDDVAQRQEKFTNEALVLHHVSRRHGLREAASLARDRLRRLQPALHLLGEES